MAEPSSWLGFTSHLICLSSIIYSLPPVTMSYLVPATRWSGPSLGPGLLFWGPGLSIALALSLLCPLVCFSLLWVCVCVTLAVSSLSQQAHLPIPSLKCHVQPVSLIPAFALRSGIIPSCVYFVFSLTRGICFFHGSCYSIYLFQSSPSDSSNSLPPVSSVSQ